MKKFYFLLIAICTLSSCNDSDSDPANDTNSNLLQRVDFHPGEASERRWHFNADGLVYQITKADGTVVQSFTYDNQNRLISTTINSTISETHTFTYDHNDFVTSVDGNPVHFNPSQNAYYTGNLNTIYRLTKINTEKLVFEGKTVNIENDVSGITQTEWLEIHVGYTNNNITGFSPDERCHSYTYDTKINPLRKATLAICRAFSFIGGSSWVNGHYNSANNPITERYCSEDPESGLMHYTYNTDNLPISQTYDHYYLGVYENSRTSINYYYQGDVLP